jgi:alpha-2-macroglobulin
MASPRPFRLAPLVISAVALSMACLQGARAPEVAPRGTLAPDGKEAGLAQAEGPFGVVFASPQGFTVDPSEITIVFNRPMRALEVAGQEAAPPVKITPSPPGKWLWVGTTGLSFTPSSPQLPRATVYNVEIPAGTRALSGEVMDKPYAFHFSTDRPRVISALAGGDPDAMEPGVTFKLRFNQPVDEAEIARAVTLFAGIDSAKGGMPRIPFDLKRPDPKNEQLVELVPRTKLPLAAPVQIVADASLHGREGPLTADKEDTFHFRTYGPLAFEKVACNDDTPHRRCAAEDGFSIELTTPVKLGAFKKALKIDPPVKLRWPRWLDDDQETKSIQMWGRFFPGRSYRVHLASAALKDVHGQPLTKDVDQAVAFDDLWPNAAIGVNGSIFDAASARPIPVGSVNAKEIDLVTGKLTEAAILGLEGDVSRSAHSLRFDEIQRLPGAVTTKLRPGAAVNKPSSHPVDVAGVLGGKDKRGPLAIGISYASRPGTRDARTMTDAEIVQVTDLGISAKISPHGSMVWVTHLANAEPVEGATVTIVRPDTAQSAPSFKTDKNGFAFIPEAAFKPDPNGEDHGVVFVHLGDDWAFRQVSSMIDGWRFGMSFELGPDRPFGMLFTERGIYRPGDTVRLKGIFRQEEKNGASTPAGRSVEIEVDGSDGQPVSKTTTALSAFGTLSVDVKVPETGRLGTYYVQARVHDSPRNYADVNADFEVAEYRAAEFKVSADSDRPSYIRGDKATWTAHGDYLFGAPMANVEARIDVTRSETYFTPPGIESFTTDDSAFLAGQSEGSERQYEVENTKAKLDAKGTAALTATLTMPGQRGPEIVTGEADVTDLSRQMISGSTSAIVHPGEFYVALDPGPDLFLKPGDPVKPKILAVDPKGAKVPQVPVTVELISRKWTVARQEVGGGFRTASSTVDKVVATCTVTTATDPATCSLDPQGAGYFIVRAKAADRRKNALAASAGIYVTGGAGETSWGDGDKNILELVADRKSYEVGQTAHVLVKSPFKSAEALVTVERAGVYSQKRMTLTGSMPTLDIPVTDDLRPNAFVSVLLLKGRSKAAPDKPNQPDVGAPAFRLGYASIPVNPEARRLKVAVKPSKSELHPGDEVDVDVDVKDRSGKPAKAEVTLYAVDEGVLSLIGYKTPDPIPIFGAPRPLKVGTVEARQSMARVTNPFSELGLDKGLEGGSGGESGLRRDFRASAYYNPGLVTDAEGHAKVRFKLPDSLTTYRIMAVAAGEDDRFGYAQDRVTTSRPLMGRPAFPRFIRAGDTLEAGVVVNAKGMPKTRVDVTVAAEGLIVDDGPQKSIDLDPSGGAEVRFAMRAPTAGKAKIRFTVKGGGAEDAVEITRDVKVPLVMEAVALYGDTTQASAEKLGDLSAIREDAGGLDVSVSSTALVGLGSGMDHLIEYPYGCTEQLVSRLIPMLPLRDLARDYHASLPKDLDPIIRKTVADVIAHQRNDGGFGLWEESPQSSPWVTAYALWGLHTAASYKVPVPDHVLEGAATYLRKALPSMLRDDMVLAAAPFLLDVLAEAGSPDPGRVGTLFGMREKLPLFAQAELLHAAILSKNDKSIVDTLGTEIEGHVRLDGDVARAVANEGDRYAPLMDSEARTSAMVLRSLLAARPTHPLASKLAMGLLGARRGGTWRNTQETAWSLLALDEYRKAQEKVEPDFVAHVFLGEAEIWSAPFHGRSLDQPKKTFPTASLVAGSGAPLAFDVEGRGRLFYEARLRYAKKALPQKPIERGFYLKKTLRAVTPEGLDEALRTIPEAGVSSFKGGDLVLADLVLVTPSPRDFVVIDDPLPAGFEAVDARLATTGARFNVDAAASRGNDDDEPVPDDVGSGRGYRQAAFLREIRDDRVLFFADHVPAGMFHYRYLARATTLGSFIVPPAKVEEMYTPEVFGRTAADVIKIGAK